MQVVALAVYQSTPAEGPGESPHLMEGALGGLHAICLPDCG